MAVKNVVALPWGSVKTVHGLASGSIKTVYGASAAWSPLTLTGLAAWFDAADCSAVGNGNPITNWVDKTAVHTATQSTAGLRPLYVASALNSLPGVNFNGDRLLTNTSLASLFTGATLNVTIYQVIPSFTLANGALAIPMAVTKASVGLTEWLDFHEFNGQTSGTQVRIDSGLSGNAGGKQAFPLLNNQTYQSAAHVYVTKWATSGSTVTGTIYVDGTQVATASTPSGFTGATTIDTVGIGGWMVSNTAGRFFTGKICDTVIASVANSDADRNQCEAYLKAKYGL